MYFSHGFTIGFLLFPCIVSSAYLMKTRHENIKLTWETVFADKIRAACAERHAIGDYRPYMVSVVGIPGSGKSTSCEVLEDELSDVGSILMPFDGYHYPKATLETLPNALDAIWRRGAPDTFDSKSLVRDLNRIRYGDEPVIRIPGFCHSQGDPEHDKHEYRRNEHKIVICEGLYLLHDQDGWESVKDYFDLSVFVDADIDRCMDRVKIRNKCIPGYTPEEIEHRVDAVDRINALTVQRCKTRADLIVPAAVY